MNLNNVKRSMPMASSSTTSVAWKSGEVVSDQFPAGLRVLVVDDDPTCLMILEKMLRTCLYEVTKCNRAETALLLLRENKNGYDIVISDVHMPDMDGFKLLECIGLEMDLPVIMMSADDGKNVVMKGVTHGACDYLIKPVRIEALKNIWQHVIRKKKNEYRELEQSGSAEEGDRQQKLSEDVDYSSSANEGNWRTSKKRKNEEEEIEDREDTSTLKKPRVVWSVELHQQFVGAVNQLGIDKAVPKKILELMNIQGLTRENVASHLQKYRLYLRRLSGVAQHPNNLSNCNSFITPQDPAYGALSSLNGLELQTLAATGQLPAQSLATLQAAGIGHSPAKPRMPMPIVDQRNLFSFGSPKVRYGDGQQQHLSNNRQMNLLHGIPTTMEPKQLTSLHHSLQSHGSINVQVNAQQDQAVQSNSLLMQMSQPQPRGQVLNDNATQVSRPPSSMGQPIASTPVAGSSGVLARNGLTENGRGATYNPVSQSASLLNIPMNNSAELPGHSFPLGSTLGIPNLSSKVPYQEEIVNSEMKVSGGYTPSYDIFSALHQHKSNDWELQNVGLTFNASQQPSSLQSNLDVGQSILDQGFSSSQGSGQNDNVSVLKPNFSATEHRNTPCVGQQLDTFFTANTARLVKSERIAEANPQMTVLTEQFGQDDLMNALLKQQGGIGSAGNEFDLDGYTMDNIRV
ncbi:hypothetical protein K2173_009137 [Erythroxylum novogranatense]|uniref:Two-component response regulator n=1 Tax=Erythroxylum novogranatense TaxID=1862640 RepID=A0AAV8TJ31_9ROSI|nr:hypothetical protein K2173_009137 [Erythroxylum novogranatense]